MDPGVSYLSSHYWKVQTGGSGCEVCYEAIKASCRHLSLGEAGPHALEDVEHLVRGGRPGVVAAPRHAQRVAQPVHLQSSGRWGRARAVVKEIRHCEEECLDSMQVTGAGAAARCSLPTCPPACQPARPPHLHTLVLAVHWESRVAPRVPHGQQLLAAGRVPPDEGSVVRHSWRSRPAIHAHCTGGGRQGGGGRGRKADGRVTSTGGGRQAPGA